MNNNIVKFTGITKLDLSAPEMLRSIAEETPKTLLLFVGLKMGLCLHITPTRLIRQLY